MITAFLRQGTERDTRSCGSRPVQLWRGRLNTIAPAQGLLTVSSPNPDTTEFVPRSPADRCADAGAFQISLKERFNLSVLAQCRTRPLGTSRSGRGLTSPQPRLNPAPPRAHLAG
eukprot:6182866-Pleurochrysis_carterae.AAC.1